MKVRRVYSPGASCVAPTDTLREAAMKMRSSGQSCLPVLEGASFRGIVSEQDLVQAMANGVPVAGARVADYTSDGCVTVSLNDDCAVAELKMLAIGCRNLPVVDGGHLVGMISMRDVAQLAER